MKINSTNNAQSSYRLELIMQVVLLVVVFLFYAFKRSTQEIEFNLIVFFIPYAIVSLIISYKLLPDFLYKKKYWQFGLAVVCLVFLVMALEELVTEQIFYPDTRGKAFPGVFFGLVQILPPVIILSSFKFAWDALMKQNELEALEQAVKDSQLQFLKSQINPHFLFNNLNNLYSYALESSPKTPKIILELSNVLRYMLYECKEEFVPLKKEIAQLESFTELNELQIEERGTVNFVKENMTGSFQIAPLILMVFIENAFKHSQSSMAQDISIDITISVSADGELRFNCKNNFQKQTNIDQLSKGIGLENVRKRLEFLYPHSHELNIRETPNKFEVDLVMQLIAVGQTVDVSENLSQGRVPLIENVVT